MFQLNQKGGLLITVLSLTAIVVFISGLFFIRQRFGSQNFNNSSNLNVKPMLKTYQNSQYGFEFKFVWDSKILNQTTDAKSGQLDVLKLTNPRLVNKQGVDENEASISEQYLSLEISKIRSCPLGVSDLTEPKVSAITVSGTKLDMVQGGSLNDTYRRFFCISYGDNTYYFVGDFSKSSPEDIRQKSVYFSDLVFSTFKFVR